MVICPRTNFYNIVSWLILFYSSFNYVPTITDTTSLVVPFTWLHYLLKRKQTGGKRAKGKKEKQARSKNRRDKKKKLLSVLVPFHSWHNIDLISKKHNESKFHVVQENKLSLMSPLEKEWEKKFTKRKEKEMKRKKGRSHTAFAQIWKSKLCFIHWITPPFVNEQKPK